MRCKYLGEDWDYQNLWPREIIRLKKNEVYDVVINSDSQVIVVNGVQMQTQPSEIRVNFSNGAWIPYMPQCFNRQWAQA